MRVHDDLVTRLRKWLEICHRDTSFVGGTVLAFEPIIIEAADLIERYEAIERPTCPTCGGTTYERTVENEVGTRTLIPCPDCTDGRMPLERCAAIARAVMTWESRDGAYAPISPIDRGHYLNGHHDLLNHLRALRP